MANRRIGVSLTMIVRDEEENLSRCLGSVRGIFDEIVVVDTGSVDRTREIAREYGAKVFEFAWVDDFAAARNAALEHATGNYAFWLDADDVVEPNQRPGLRRLLEGLRPGEPYAWRLPLVIAERGAAAVWGSYARLFPVRPEIRWVGRIHEAIEPALRRAGIPICDWGCVVRHNGYKNENLTILKMERNSRLLTMPPRSTDEAAHVARRTALVLAHFRDLAFAEMRRTGEIGPLRGVAIRAAERMGAPATAALLRGLPDGDWSTAALPLRPTNASQ